MAQVKDNTRSRDRAKQEFEWEAAKVIYEFPEGHTLAGHTVVYLDNPNDTAQLGKLMGHCAGTHFIWTAEEKVWYFFAMLGPNGQPHVTIHAKQTKWLNKRHPRDEAESMPIREGGGTVCLECKGYGGRTPGGENWYPGEREATRCEACDGSGIGPPPKGFVAASAAGYPTFQDVLNAFESLGQQYEAGKYKPLRFTSNTYDRLMHNGGGIVTFAYQYGGPIAKPKFGSTEAYNAYVKAYKALADEYDKEVGAVKIEGRPFKFDGKQLTVLSFTGKGQTEARKYRKGFHECLVELAKSKKEVADGS